MLDFTEARRKMVDGQVRPNDVTDLRIIDAMSSIPRELFVPETKRALAYLDLDLDLSGDAANPRYLIKPALFAKLLQAAEIAATDRVLVAGCAGAYGAAVIAAFASHVVATERAAGLVATARSVLSQLAIGNVTVTQAAAAEGDSSNAPYDVIVLNGATQVAPQLLYRQLAMGGRLVGVFAEGATSRAKIVTRSAGDFGSRPLFDAVAPVLPGLEAIPVFSF
jgi:protein-L-isoaspartate(D-aspartate) O-methyltransferase